MISKNMISKNKIKHNLDKNNSLNNIFNKIILDDLPDNSFEEILKTIKFENIAKGRQGRVLVQPYNDLIPLVRTTTKYNMPSKEFPFSIGILAVLIGIKLKQLKLIDIDEEDDELLFDNVLAEVYDSSYTKMGFHTDQSQDLADDSHICLYSCYENDSNEDSDLRILRVTNKITKKTFDIKMENNSVIIFSTKANSIHRHSILLESTTSKNKWLGLTFRKSKTYLKFDNNNIPHIIINKQLEKIGFSFKDPDKDKEKLENNSIIYDINKYPKLTLSTDKGELKNYYKLKGIENREIDFEYPMLYFTTSKSDLMIPEKTKLFDDSED